MRITSVVSAETSNEHLVEVRREPEAIVIKITGKDGKLNVGDDLFHHIAESIGHIVEGKRLMVAVRMPNALHGASAGPVQAPGAAPTPTGPSRRRSVAKKDAAKSATTSAPPAPPAKAESDPTARISEQNELHKKLNMPVNTINFGGRANGRCQAQLKNLGANLVGELVQMKAEDLLVATKPKVKGGFGGDSLERVKKALKHLGLSLGMKAGQLSGWKPPQK